MNIDDMKAPPKAPMKQRSFYMDDETYALIEAYAARLGTSNGTALRMLVRHALLEETPLGPRPDPVPIPGSAADVLQHTVQTTAAPAAIILPPDNQETFRVPEKFREKGPRVPRVKHSDDDF